ncbi:MAG: TRAP transporter large permease, partial [Planctomycetaceae bacterium]|nr:TRAP transporter large permease [Planctomycetaceae bacterium]
MTVVAILLLVVFTVLMLFNVPIAIAMGTACLVALFAIGGEPAELIARRLVNGIDSFSLLAIPLFIFSGLLMGQGGMARRLIDLASALMGRLPNGLAYVNTLACMLFGSISGSAAAAVSSIGSSIIPEMERKGYDRAYSTALTTSSSVCGLIIPPSNIMIVYAVACGNVSIAALFLAGILPGILFGLCIMAATFLFTKQKVRDTEGSFSWDAVEVAFGRAFLSLFLIVLIIGGILLGIFTATEAAAVAVAYSFILTMFVYREIRWRALPGILTQAAVTTSVVMLLIGICSALSWIMATADIPQTVSALLLAISENPIILLLLINLLLLIVGIFMDMTPAVLIFTPIFLPITRMLGIDDIHFGIIMIANLCIGLCTPPVGTCLFVGCSVGKTTIMPVTMKMIPYAFAMLVAV